MKTKIIFLAALLLGGFFSSCGHKSQTRTKEDNIILTDPLEKIIAIIGTADYDLAVKMLKDLPEYENALFLTPRENQEYLLLVQKNADSFKGGQQYWSYVNDNWRSFNDTTLVKREMSLSCEIVFDTTQIARPLLSLTNKITNTFKNKKNNAKCFNFELNVYNYYYIPKFQIGYVTINSKDIYSNGPNYHSYLTIQDWLDMQIKEGLQIN